MVATSSLRFVRPARQITLILAATLTLSLQVQQTQAEELFTLRSVDGRLAIFPHVIGQVSCGSKSWSAEENGPIEFENYNPGGYFDGRVFARSRSGVLEVGGWRHTYRDHQVIHFLLSQAPHVATAEYTVRTPVGQPDMNVQMTEPDLTLLLVRHPELSAMLGEVLAALGDENSYEFDPSVRAQVDPETWLPSTTISEQVGTLLPLLLSTGWRERKQAEESLVALGRDGALYMLLKLDRSGLQPQQNLVIDAIVRRYPVLSLSDCQSCRAEPERLIAPARIEDQVAARARLAAAQQPVASADDLDE